MPMLIKIKNQIQSNKINMIIFVTCVLLYGINELLLKRQDIMRWLFSGHFNDFLAPLLLLSYSNILIKIAYNKTYNSFLGLSTGMLAVSLIWEYAAPYIKSGAVTDPLDIIAYYVGFMVYWIAIKLITVLKVKCQG